LTLDHLSSLIGDDERTDRSTTVGDDGRWSSTESASVRRLAPSALLRTLRAGEAVVVYGALPPVRLRLRPYFEAGRRRWWSWWLRRAGVRDGAAAATGRGRQTEASS
jgi:hypothetical protein